MSRNKLIRITTVPSSLQILLRGQHRFMSHHFDVVGVSSEGGELVKISEEEGIRAVAIEMSRKITPIADLKSLWRMYLFLKKEQPTIVHTHTPKAGIIGMLAAKIAGVPNRLHTVAGLPLMEASGNKRKVLDAVEKLTYACSTKVYPNSQGLADFILKNNYTPSHKVKVIGNGSSNGINTNFFSPEVIEESQVLLLKDQLGIRKEDVVFIFVGRLVGDKGINELISAFDNLVKKYPRTQLLLVGGEEPELDPLEEDTVKKIISHGNIHSLGFQQDIRPFMACADALVFPSYREGFPNVVMQAGAMGLASIVSNINGCNEIIFEKENGLIIPVKDSEAIEKAMEYIIMDPRLLLKLRQNARPMITQRYEQTVVWNALLEEYKKLITE